MILSNYEFLSWMELNSRQTGSNWLESNPNCYVASMMDDKTPFFTMTPDRVIDAVESRGWLSDYRILALNSYENRVYQVGIDQQEPVIAKFYRPGRWSDAQIQEEHDFCFERKLMGIYLLLRSRLMPISMIHLRKVVVLQV